MKLLDAPPEIQGALGLWQMLRQLGFVADEIYTAHVEGRLYLVVDGDQKFRIGIGATGMSRSEFEARWEALAAALPEIDETELRVNYDMVATPMRLAQVLDALDSAGIRAPDDPRRKHLN